MLLLRFETPFAPMIRNRIDTVGYCGSCWAFAATEQIESDAIRAGFWHPNMTLSPQQIVDCDSKMNGAPQYSFGCYGGYPEYAYSYVQFAGGLVTEAAYPYTSGWTGTNGTCKVPSTNGRKITVQSYSQVIGEANMVNYVLNTGPLAVYVVADFGWQTYRGGGIISKCSGTITNHVVQAVGVDTVNGYWILRNQWGTWWGEKGYIRLKLVC
jgi:C1A family cysteine protease